MSVAENISRALVIVGKALRGQHMPQKPQHRVHVECPVENAQLGGVQLPIGIYDLAFTDAGLEEFCHDIRAGKAPQGFYATLLDDSGKVIEHLIRDRRHEGRREHEQGELMKRRAALIEQREAAEREREQRRRWQADEERQHAENIRRSVEASRAAAAVERERVAATLVRGARDPTDARKVAASGRAVLISPNLPRKMAASDGATPALPEPAPGVARRI